MPVKTSAKHRRDYADQRWRKLIRERDQVCQARGLWDRECGFALEAAHFYPRRHLSVRWDLDNGALLCSIHHGWFDGHEPEKWAWVAERLGPQRLLALRMRRDEAWHKNYDRVHEELAGPKYGRGR